MSGEPNHPSGPGCARPILTSSRITIVRLVLSHICLPVGSYFAGILSKCRTLSVTGRVRVICSRQTSKVRIPPVLSGAGRNLTGIEHGHVKISTFLIPYHVGDIVDIKANAAQQKGMPHKFYHGSVLVTFTAIATY